MRALRKGQAAIFNLTGDVRGEARIVERAFGIGPSALTEATALLAQHLKQSDCLKAETMGPLQPPGLFATEPGDLLPRILPLILPRLVSCNGFGCFSLTEDGDDGILQSHPDALLAILHAVLTGDPTRWPYRIDRVLEQLAANPVTAEDERLHALRRRLGRRCRG
jgi:hypothetical protein